MIPGLRVLPRYLSDREQEILLQDVQQVVQAAPLYRPRSPNSGLDFAVEMTSCGALGWVSDVAGHRYQATHPTTARPWPKIPSQLLAIWDEVSEYEAPPQSCLVTFFRGYGAELGLHRDKTEEAIHAPIISISLGDTATLRIITSKMLGELCNFDLESGTIIVMGGEARHCYHAVDNIQLGSSKLLRKGGRLSLSLRRVTQPRIASDGKLY